MGGELGCYRRIGLTMLTAPEACQAHCHLRDQAGRQHAGRQCGHQLLLRMNLADLGALQTETRHQSLLIKEENVNVVL